ncbi:helix-turn-helix domain-containing protein [Limobrevibacterium gyesilva]|uniref:Helix-turn-helix domain-containing protein n=1 Tax=Limobrevibacterium gyesilva TaxID=2991712 RepID=A0AA41YSG4_9PROT|nr:helix-turn-helix domain-containing protein [Limobrevibacterium gyesilva]
MSGETGDQAAQFPGPAGQGVGNRGEKESRPSPIDVHVGARIRLRRTLMGMSQERLGEALGLTFQQVQKYERGVNRVGASRLFDLSRVLDVPISFFFDDMPEPLAHGYGAQSSNLTGRRAVGFADAQDAFADDAFSRRETLELVRAYYRIPDAAVRKKMFELIKSMTPDNPE